MKLYILRHEDRTNDATFFSPLTEKGLINANKLVDKLEKLNITKIYSSPFIRTLQTIYPFSKKKNIKVNLEYNLIEIQHESIIAPKSYGSKLPLYMAQLFNYNPNYITVREPTAIKYPETFNDVVERTIPFINALVKKYGNTNEVILLVTHQSICQSILKALNKSDLDYPMGTLSLIYNGNQWIYNVI